MFLLDTDIVSELRKPAPGAGVEAWARPLPPSSLFLSVVVIEELEIGVLLAERRNAAVGAALRGWLDNQVLPGFAGRILPVDVAVARRSAALHVPAPRPIRDALMQPEPRSRFSTAAISTSPPLWDEVSWRCCLRGRG